MKKSSDLISTNSDVLATLRKLNLVPHKWKFAQSLLGQFSFAHGIWNNLVMYKLVIKQTIEHTKNSDFHRSSDFLATCREVASFFKLF